MSNKDIKVYKNIMSSNDLWAEKTRSLLKEKNILMYNIIGSPGCGKTTLLESLFDTVKEHEEICVLEGDVETANDAERLAKYGIQVSQLITSGGCHLEAKHVYSAINDFDLEKIKYLIVENVGNLVCPAEFDLGEKSKIAVLSVTEGEDKPLKYPVMFQSSQICVLNKTDLLPYLDFKVEEFKKQLDIVVPDLPLIELSAKSGEGFQALIDVLQ